MKKNIKYILIILLTIFITSPVYSVNENDRTEKQTAVVLTAEAFLNKGEAIQYDQRSISKYNFKNNSSYTGIDLRGDLNLIPEDATMDNKVYTDCALFTYAVYKQSLDIEIPYTTKKLIEEANNNKQNKDYIPLYEEISENSNIEELKNNLQTGDLIVYRTNNNNGHVMLYVGDGMIIHSSGSDVGYSDYDYVNKKDNKEDNGTVRRDRIDILTEKDQDRYLLKKDSNGTFVNSKYAIIRPINSNNRAITDASKTRIKYPGIIIEKRANIKDKQTVKLGENITYSIQIINNSNKTFENVKVQDNIPEYTRYKENTANYNASIDNNQIKWNIDKVLPNEKLELKFSVIVENNSDNLGKIINSKGKVDNIYTNEIKNQIGQKLTEEEEKAIIETAYVYYNKQQKEQAIKYSSNFDIQNAQMNIIPEQANEDNPIQLTTCGFINSIYFNALGINMNIRDTKGFINQIIEEYKIMGNDQMYKLRSEDKNNALRSMLVSDLYGGMNVITVDNQDRAKEINEWNLEIGDLIVYGDGDSQNASIWIYLGNNKMMTITSTEGIILREGEKGKQKIESLLGQKRFAILRPALVYNSRNLTKEAEKRIENIDSSHYGTSKIEDTSYGNIINRIADRFYKNNKIKFNIAERQINDLPENIEKIDDIGLIYSIYNIGFNIKIPNTKTELMKETEMIVDNINENNVDQNDLKKGDILLYSYTNQNGETINNADIYLGTNRVMGFINQDRIDTTKITKVITNIQDGENSILLVLRPSQKYNLTHNNTQEQKPAENIDKENTVKVDNTVSEKILPKAGDTFLVRLIVIVGIIAIVSYAKIKRFEK